MKNNRVKIIVSIIIGVLIVLLECQVFAIKAPEDISIKGETYGTEGLINFGNSVLNTIFLIGIIGTIIVLIVIGFKYMVGSTEEKAKYKSSILPYAIGMFMLFGAIPIVDTIYKYSTNVDSMAPQGEFIEAFIRVPVCENDHVWDEGYTCPICGTNRRGKKVMKFQCKGCKVIYEKIPEDMVCPRCNRWN